MKTAILETLKSIGRFIWFAFLGAVVAALTALVSNTDLLQLSWTVWDITVPAGIWIVFGITALIKVVDSYIHKNTNIASNGIALPFLQK